MTRPAQIFTARDARLEKIAADEIAMDREKRRAVREAIKVARLEVKRCRSLHSHAVAGAMGAVTVSLYAADVNAALAKLYEAYAQSRALGRRANGEGR